jgi:hypothetical protein
MKIIANGITSLTDARYFAAMGVDWIGFDMGLHSPLSIEHVMTFADWLEGPQFFLDVRGRSEDQIAVMLGNFQAAGLLMDEGASLPHYAGMIIATEYSDASDRLAHTLIYTHEEWQKEVAQHTSIEADEVWVEIGSIAEYQMLQKGMDRISGIVVSGMDEQKIGVMSYDNLDKIIEVIRA